MDVWFFIAALAAEVVGTMAGFGSSMILLPIALLFFDFSTALVLVSFMHLFGNIGRIIFFFRGVSWRTVVNFGVISVVGAIIGALFVRYIDQELLKALLGLFLVGYGAFTLAEPGFRLRRTLPTMLIGGTTSGFLAGLIGTGGALRGAFLTAFKLPKVQYISTAAVIALVVDGARIPLYIKDGLMTGAYYWMLPILFVLALAGSYIGRKLVVAIPQKLFQRLVLGCLILGGMKLVIDYLL